MKIKSFKRMGAMFLASLMCVCMCFGMCTTAFAAETENATYETRETVTASTKVPAGKTAELYLGTVPGHYNTALHIVTACESTSGKINWELYCNGIKFKSGSLGVNDMLDPAIPMDLSTGRYTIKLTNTAKKETTVFAYFE